MLFCRHCMTEIVTLGPADECPACGHVYHERVTTWNKLIRVGDLVLALELGRVGTVLSIVGPCVTVLLEGRYARVFGADDLASFGQGFDTEWRVMRCNEEHRA